MDNLHRSINTKGVRPKRSPKGLVILTIVCVNFFRNGMSNHLLSLNNPWQSLQPLILLCWWNMEGNIGEASISIEMTNYLLFRMITARWSVTSLRGPGERNFNAVSHKSKLTGTDWIELNWCARWFMGYGIKILSPGPRNDVTDHLEEKYSQR